MVVNPGLQQSGAGFPACWSKAGNRTNSYAFAMTSKAYSGSTAVQLSISKYTSGERLAMISENSSCAPSVTAGDQYNLGVYYMSNTPNAVIEVYRHDVKTGWQFWMDLKNLPAAGTYKYASVRTPAIPTGTNQLSFGVALYGTGTVITDNYSMVNASVAASAVKCTAGLACTKGAWQVLPFPSPVRTIHSVVLDNGDILFVAGSGNDPSEFAAGHLRVGRVQPRQGHLPGHPDARRLLLRRPRPAAERRHPHPRREQGLPERGRARSATRGWTPPTSSTRSRSGTTR